MKKNSILKICSFAGILLFIFSFFDSFILSSEKSVKTAFVNPSSKNKIINIVLFENGFVTELFLDNSIWKGKCGTMIFPVEQKQVEDFTESLSRIRKTTEISKFPKNQRNETFLLSYTDDSGKTTLIHFGKEDFSRTQRYYWLESNEKLFRTQNDLDRFLQADPRIWYDPYLIPKNIDKKDLENNLFSASLFINGKQKILGESDSQVKLNKLSELRHGQLFYGSTDILVKSGSLTAVKADKTIINLDFYDLQGDEESGKAVIYSINGSWNYVVQISGWTFRSICGLFNEKE